jgi:hypothetical protein
MLKMYSNVDCTLEVLFAQAFAGTGSAVSFALTNFIGSALGSVYLETQTTQAGVTFASGVGSGFSGLTVNALIGFRVIHNGTFRGTVVSNTATTITISDVTYTYATASSCVVSSYVKLTSGTDYNISGNNIVLTGSAPTSTQIVHGIPTSTLGANFGGTAGSVKTSQTSFWLKATPGYTYDTLQVQCLDHSQTQASLTTASTIFASGVGSGFSGLVAGALIGRAVNHGGTFRGVITANTTTTVTISDTGYTNAVASDSVAYTIGSAMFAPDSSGSPGTYANVIHPSAITDGTPVRIWMEDTVTIPVAAMNYPNQIPYVTGIEYLA